MATNTYVALYTTALGTATSSVTFSLSGVTGYTDLVLMMNYGGSSATDVPYMRFNGDTGTNYSMTSLFGTGSAAFSQRTTSQAYINISKQAGFENAVNQTAIIQIMNYSNTTTNKTSLHRVNVTGGSYPAVEANVSLWRSTAAINSITIFTSGGNFLAGSTFTVYGIANADNFTKATGGIITEDATYTYHTFGSTGTFTPKQSLTADILVVAGGGGGSAGQNASSEGAGGGAGGVLLLSSQSLSATGYTCSVGAGGNSGTAGANSQFGVLTAAVGGGRGGTSTITAGPGGSGGGSWYSAEATGTGTSGQGNNGGRGNSGYSAGGGGGAGSPGTSPAGGASTGAAGGDGTSAYNTWSSATNIGVLISGTYYFAAGGGGTGGTQATANGGIGGGGSGAIGTTVGGPAVANTGSGGGGGRSTSNQAGGNGGSGVVIIRYPK